MEGRAGDQRCRGTRSRKTPQGPTWTWVQGKGDNGEENGYGNDRRRRNAERGAETSGRIWGGGGGGRRPGGRCTATGEAVGSGCTYRCYNYKRMIMGWRWEEEGS